MKIMNVFMSLLDEREWGFDLHFEPNQKIAMTLAFWFLGSDFLHHGCVLTYNLESIDFEEAILKAVNLIKEEYPLEKVAELKAELDKF